MIIMFTRNIKNILIIHSFVVICHKEVSIRRWCSRKQSCMKYIDNTNAVINFEIQDTFTKKKMVIKMNK